LKKYTMLLIIFTTVLSARASENGGYAGSYLRMGLGARSLAMGNTGIASPVNAYSAFYNPAVFGFIDQKLVGLSHSFLSMDRRYNFISFSMKVPPAAGFSISWMESGFGNVRSYDSIGRDTGEINHSANAVYFSVGRKILDNLSVGLSLKILFEYINDGTDEFDYKSNGVGFDFGVLYKIRDDLTLAYQLKDLNSKLKAQTDKIQ
jgi:long-subunit fatty acid transport protein